MNNIELKATLRDRSAADATCARIGASAEGDLRQTDTYFRVPEGRLKLRDFENGKAELIFYHRPDIAGPKMSDYDVVPVPPSLGEMLARSLGTVTVVRKVRTLHLWENVRIHLDRVKELGDFLEFEAVVSEQCGPEECHAKVERLCVDFGIADEDLLETSYLEMMLSQ